MEEVLFRIAGAIRDDPVSLFFCAAIGAWFFAPTVIWAFTLGKRWPSRLVAITPTGLATLGVLGTFTGILIGLLDFDVARIDESVPDLLAGLKIAFTTSIVGIAASVLFRFLRTLAPGPARASGTTPEDIFETLREIRDDGREASERSGEQLAQIRNAISSDGDGSLLTQVQKLRTTVQDGQNALAKEFREFAAHMVENNQKAIIEALEQVIRDFNANLTTQFGENFKQLNRAVADLVLWQDNYREHVEASERRLELAVESMEAAETALRGVRDHAERIPAAIEPLEPTLKGILNQTTALDAHLHALAQLRERAAEAFPVIEENLNRITGDLSRSVEAAIERSQSALERSQREHDRLNIGFETLRQNAETAQTRFSEELSAAHTRTQTEIRQRFEEFDRQMQQQLQGVLTELGTSLASVSEKFVTDYTPLTERLRSVLEIAERARR